jgi:lipopolysaccharide/colanic/teichoic acid biosynthesis glycosyltransferase
MAVDYRWIKKYIPEKRKFKGKEYFLVKRIFDLFVVILTIPIWISVVGAIALAIKISDPKTPVMFLQKRTGKGGQRFLMHKFRTMVPNAEALKEKYAHLNELTWPDFKISNDPRVTSIGRLLRKTSLDELPQLFNILKGDMSLVGPRPTFFSSKEYKLWHTARLDVLPGITGLWQITARSTADWDNRSRLDIVYIERRCFSLDIEILFRTIEVVLLTRGAR